MVFGLSESEAFSPEERKLADTNRIKLLASELGVNDLQVDNVIRLDRSSSKVRPIKLTGLKPTQRSNLLLSASRIPKIKESLGFQRVFIKPDLSLKEQLANRELRSEWRRRRQAGESVSLKGGRIVENKLSGLFFQSSD